MTLKMLMGKFASKVLRAKVCSDIRAKIAEETDKLGNPFQEYWLLRHSGISVALKVGRKSDMLATIDGELVSMEKTSNGAVFHTKHDGSYEAEPISRKTFVRLNAAAH